MEHNHKIPQQVIDYFAQVYATEPHFCVLMGGYKGRPIYSVYFYEEMEIGFDICVQVDDEGNIIEYIDEDEGLFRSGWDWVKD